MPINADPNATVDVWLECDKEIERSIRPTFQVKHLTHREANQVIAAYSQAGSLHAAEKYDEAIAKIEEVHGIAIRGFKNMRFRGNDVEPGTPPGDFLTQGEKWELAGLCLSGPKLTEDDRKKSGSPSTSGTGPSASHAEAPESAASD